MKEKNFKFKLFLKLLINNSSNHITCSVTFTHYEIFLTHLLIWNFRSLLQTTKQTNKKAKWLLSGFLFIKKDTMMLMSISKLISIQIIYTHFFYLKVLRVYFCCALWINNYGMSFMEFPWIPTKTNFNFFCLFVVVIHFFLSQYEIFFKLIHVWPILWSDFTVEWVLIMTNSLNATIFAN